MNNFIQNPEKLQTPNPDQHHQSNGKRPRNLFINLRSSMILPLILVSFFGEPALATAENIDYGTGKPAGIEYLVRLQEQAVEGNLDAMYWLGMLHIEGKIENADYDKGVSLLQRAAFRGHPDADRMWSFMDNAFSGDGC